MYTNCRVELDFSIPIRMERLPAANHPFLRGPPPFMLKAQNSPPIFHSKPEFAICPLDSPFQVALYHLGPKYFIWYTSNIVVILRVKYFCKEHPHFPPRMQNLGRSQNCIGGDISQYCSTVEKVVARHHLKTEYPVFCAAIWALATTFSTWVQYRSIIPTTSIYIVTMATSNTTLRHKLNSAFEEALALHGDLLCDGCFRPAC